MARSTPSPRKVHFHPPRRVSERPALLVVQALGNTSEFSWLCPHPGIIESAAIHTGPFDGASVATIYLDNTKGGEQPIMAGPTEFTGSFKVAQWQRVKIRFDRELPDVNVSFTLRAGK